MQSSRKAAERGNLVLQTLISCGQPAIACGGSKVLIFLRSRY